jgi:transposase
LTDGAGEPLSIQLYAGNTSDPPTFLDAVEQLKVRLGTQEIAVAGSGVSPVRERWSRNWRPASQ